MNQLATNISPKLAELEGIIERGRETFLEVGKALAEIRDGKLYREQGYKTFEAYLTERWEICRSQGYRLIFAAKAAEMSPIGDKPENEYQARKRRPTMAGFVKKQRQLRSTSQQLERPEDLDVEAELAAFKQRVAVWETGFSREDYIRLVGEVITYCEKIDDDDNAARWGLLPETEEVTA